jgi:hypothetical protein
LLSLLDGQGLSEDPSLPHLESLLMLSLVLQVLATSETKRSFAYFHVFSMSGSVED